MDAEPGRPQRLQKYLAAAGVASRRACEEIIAQGRVRVNGVVVTTPGTSVNSADIVYVDEKAVYPKQERLYFAFYKPPFVMTTMADPQGRDTVAQYFAALGARVFPVGRLDYQTEGLLFITNDGQWANRIAHPRYHMEKEYLCVVAGSLPQKTALALERGVSLEDGVTAPAKVRGIKPFNNRTQLQLTIREGRNRQVRRMLETLGHEVLYLKRIRIGPVALGELKSGEYRALTPAELEGLERGVFDASRRGGGM